MDGWLRFRRGDVVFREVTVGWLPFPKAGAGCKVRMEGWLRSRRGDVVFRAVTVEWSQSRTAVVAYKALTAAWSRYILVSKPFKTRTVE